MTDIQYVNVESAWTMDGPWSQGVRIGSLIFTSGQIPVSPTTRKVVEGGIGVQVAQSLRNVEQILNAAGASLQDVVKVTVFLSDYANFEAMNDAYAGFFDKHAAPARTCITARELPTIDGRQVQVIIDAIAVVSSTRADS